MPIPEWLRQPAPPEARPPRPLAPSQIAEDRDAAAAASPGNARGGAAGDVAACAVRTAAWRGGRRSRMRWRLRWLERAGVDQEWRASEIAGLGLLA